MDIREFEPLAAYTTFGIGGPARHFVEVESEDSIREALGWARERGVRVYTMAGGSNLLVADEGLDGLVMRIVSNEYGISDTRLTANAGCDLLLLIRATADEGLVGWESMAGIPGTIGGAVRGNAGAFGTEVKDVVEWVRVLNIRTEDVHEFSGAECAFAYRDSYFKSHPEFIITRVHVRLQEGSAEDARKKIEHTLAERERRHIQNVAAAGSYFKNPIAPFAVQQQFEKEKGVESREGRVPAGWLIEKVGLKGFREGAAEASVQHPNYLRNTGGASARDVQTLASRIKEAVHKEFGIHLEEEAVILS